MENFPFFEYIFPVISILSLLLGLFGAFIISVGSAKSAWEYIKNKKNSFQKIRLIFGQHLIIGLDFFVGKDIIDTMLINTGINFWEEITILIIVVVIRISLTIMAERELQSLTESKNI